MKTIEMVRDLPNRGAPEAIRPPPRLHSLKARRDMESLVLEPFWLCQWREVVFIHLEADPELLQAATPFPLDFFEGRAFVSLVAFTLRDMRPRPGGRLARWLFKPFGTHRFLNVRTYVRQDDNRGIHFLAEYLDAPWLNHVAGPLLYGLPFHVGKLRYEHQEATAIRGSVAGKNGQLVYQSAIDEAGRFSGRETDDADPELTTFLLERYRAYTEREGRRGWFPVWHEPWEYQPVDLRLRDDSLLHSTGAWARTARMVGAHFSSGLGEVWMGLRQTLPGRLAEHE